MTSDVGSQEHGEIWMHLKICVSSFPFLIFNFYLLWARHCTYTLHIWTSLLLIVASTCDLCFADEEPKLRNLPQIWLQSHTLKYPALQPLERVINAQLLGTWATFSPLTAQYTCILLGFSHLWNEEAELENPFTSTILCQNNLLIEQIRHDSVI